jgi:HlyD family secretion protein
LEKLRLQLQSDRLTQKSAMATLKADLVQAKIEAQADEILRKDGLVPVLVANKSRAHADELETRYALEEERLTLGDQSAPAQLKVQEAEVERLKKLYHLKKAQMDDLKVKAGIAGVLQHLGDDHSLQPGQQLIAGANIARIANPAKLKAEVKVAETQAKDIQFDQRATIDTRNGIVEGHVVRIDPVVQNGTVTVDLALDAPPPQGSRPDLSVDATIVLERLEGVLHIGRPVTGQVGDTTSLFKLVDGGKRARRVPVKLGRASVSSVEIVQGLSEGDQIILSDMSQYDGHDQVRLR